MKSHPPHLSRPRRGSILILTLWLILVLSIMAYSLTYELRIGLRMTSMSMRKLRAEALARAGLSKAVMDLRNDRLMGVALQPITIDTLNEVWSLNQDKTDVKYGDGTYTVRIVDEESKFDINILQLPRAELLKTILMNAGGYHDVEAQDIASAIIDFIDPDFVTSGRIQGDEVEVLTKWGLDKYGKSLPPGWTFRPKNDLLQNLDELMAVPGITAAMMHGDPDAEPSDPIARVDFMHEEGGLQSKTVALEDCLTVHTAGYVNINTASPTVLKLLLTAATHGTQNVDSMVRLIMNTRKTVVDPHANNKVTGFTNISQLAQIGIDPTLLQTISTLYPLNVSSHYFTIYARGNYQGVTATRKVTVDVQPEPFPLDPSKSSTFGTRDADLDGSLKNQPGNKIDPAVRVQKIEEL